MRPYSQAAGERKSPSHTQTRTVVSRQGSAVCRDCPAIWTDGWAVSAGETHSEKTGHRVLATYTAVYSYATPTAVSA